MRQRREEYIGKYCCLGCLEHRPGAPAPKHGRFCAKLCVGRNAQFVPPAPKPDGIKSAEDAKLWDKGLEHYESGLVFKKLFGQEGIRMFTEANRRRGDPKAESPLPHSAASQKVGSRRRNRIR